MSLRIAITLVILFHPLFANGASFDCKKSQTDVERLICTNPHLSALDTRLGAVYKNELEAGEDKAAIRKTQIEWLNLRNQCTDFRCLAQKYQERIETLETKAKTAISKGSNRYRWYLVSGGAWTPEAQLLDKIRENLKTYVDSWAKIERVRLQDWSSYIFQYQGRNGDRGKIVYINALCSTNPEWKLNEEMVPAGNGRGGACYFNLQYDPELSLFFALNMDDRWRNDEGTRVLNSECWGAGNTLEQSACFGNERTEIEGILATVVERYKNEPSFKDEQTAWMAEREKTCNEEASELAGGTGYANRWVDCHIRISKKRIHDLIDRASRNK